MPTISRPALLDKAARTVIALGLAFLAGCQSPPPASLPQAVEPWRVLERIGNVRATRNAEALAKAIHPGDVLIGGHILSTGRGGIAILKTGGVQLTLGENTSVQLSGPGMTDVSLNHGQLRVRAATAANRKTRIVTRQFDIHSSSTSFVLHANQDGATVSVDSGSIVLATSDGQHRIVLSAGTDAMLNGSTNNDLSIRRASSETFTKVAPLSTTVPDGSVSSSITPPTSNDRPIPAEDSDMIIRPASLPSPKRDREEPTSSPASPNRTQVVAQDAIPPRHSEIIPATSDIAPKSLTVEPLDTRPSNDPGLSSSSSLNDDVASPSQRNDNIDELDILRMQFDRLIEGLADDL